MTSCTLPQNLQSQPSHHHHHHQPETGKKHDDKEQSRISKEESHCTGGVAIIISNKL